MRRLRSTLRRCDLPGVVFRATIDQGRPAIQAGILGSKGNEIWSRPWIIEGEQTARQVAESMFSGARSALARYLHSSFRFDGVAIMDNRPLVIIEERR